MEPLEESSDRPTWIQTLRIPLQKTLQSGPVSWSRPETSESLALKLHGFVEGKPIPIPDYRLDRPDSLRVPAQDLPGQSEGFGKRLTGGSHALNQPQAECLLRADPASS